MPMNSYKAPAQKLFLLFFFVGIYGFWTTYKVWFGGGFFDLGSIRTPTVGLIAVWVNFGLWGTFSAVCLAGFIYTVLPSRNWDQWYSQNRIIVQFFFVAAVFAAGLALRFAVLQQAPLTDDESNYLFTAETLRSGHLTLPSPALPEFYDRFALINNGRIYSAYFYGWPMVLALAQAVHAIDFINPLLCALSILPLASILSRYCRAPAVLGGLICYSTSLLVLLSSATLLGYTSCLFFMLGFIHFGLKLAEDERSTRLDALAAAVCGSAAFFIRPSAAVAVCSWVGIYMVWRLSRCGKDRLFIFLVVSAMFGAAFLLMNQQAYGEYFTTGYQQDWKIQASQAPDQGATGISALLQFQLWTESFTGAVLRLGSDFLGWPSAILVVGLLCFAGTRTWPHLLALISVVLVNVYIRDHGIDTFGPVHLLEGAGALIVLLAAAAQRLADKSTQACREGAADASRLVLAAFMGIAINAWATYFALRTLCVGVIAANISEPFKAAEKLDKPALIFSQRPFIDQRSIAPLRHFVFFKPTSVPDSHKKILWVNDLGNERNLDLIRQFPDREPYRLAWTEKGRAVLIPIAQ